MKMLPEEIERKSFEIIRSELKHECCEETAPVLLRVIHASADFDYEENLVFSPGVMAEALETIRRGTTFVTDTNMALSGINKAALQKMNCQAVCFMADKNIAAAAKEQKTTRAEAAVKYAAGLYPEGIYVVGNAPTALLTLHDLISEGKISPKLVIGVPVGFVNVVESKEKMLSAKVPYIIARGRKGGSSIAAAICNALLYTASGRILSAR